MRRLRENEGGLHGDGGETELLLTTYYLLLTTYCLLLTAYDLRLTCERMKEGVMAMVAKRNSSEPSGLAAPKASLGSSVALQQMPTRSQLRMRRLAW